MIKAAIEAARVRYKKLTGLTYTGMGVPPMWKPQKQY
jgi:hypothetical protein